MANFKILVVDDEMRMRKIINDFLSKNGYTVLEAEDGEEALKMFYEINDIDLILLDVMMPKIDGWEVCKEIRKDSFHRPHYCICGIHILMCFVRFSWISRIVVYVLHHQP